MISVHIYLRLIWFLSSSLLIKSFITRGAHRDPSSNFPVENPPLHPSSRSRILYDTFPVENGEYHVKTIIKNITEPSGLALGYYKGSYGLFISSTSLLAIYFYDLLLQTYQLVAGVPYNNGNQDGQMLYSLFSSPTRLAFDQLTNRLYVTERNNGIIRILDFNSDQVKTLYYYSVTTNEDQSEQRVLTLLQFEHSVQLGGDFPGLDIQYSPSNSMLYVVDTISLYQISAITISSDGIYIATLQEYTSLVAYMNSKGYPIDEVLRSCIYSVAPDVARNVLYVSVSYAKNVILQVSVSLRIYPFSLFLSISSILISWWFRFPWIQLSQPAILKFCLEMKHYSSKEMSLALLPPSLKMEIYTQRS
jgi:hypothetical protein